MNGQLGTCEVVRLVYHLGSVGLVDGGRARSQPITRCCPVRECGGTVPQA